MAEVKCRRCRQKIPADVALYQDAWGKPTKTPICQPCLDEVVRGPDWPWRNAVVVGWARPAQRSAGL